MLKREKIIQRLKYYGGIIMRGHGANLALQAELKFQYSLNEERGFVFLEIEMRKTTLDSARHGQENTY